MQSPDTHCEPAGHAKGSATHNPGCWAAQFSPSQNVPGAQSLKELQRTKHCLNSQMTFAPAGRGQSLVVEQGKTLQYPVTTQAVPAVVQLEVRQLV